MVECKIYILGRVIVNVHRVFMCVLKIGILIASIMIKTFHFSRIATYFHCARVAAANHFCFAIRQFAYFLKLSV